ncbi:MAG: hypothetical protein M1831_000333 [Alyxoria varia]|nr:MAG: hypothetical protein M1831_000333 [Alyxoria varia]
MMDQAELEKVAKSVCPDLGCSEDPEIIKVGIIDSSLNLSDVIDSSFIWLRARRHTSCSKLLKTFKKINENTSSFVLKQGSKQIPHGAYVQDLDGDPADLLVIQAGPEQSNDDPQDSFLDLSKPPALSTRGQDNATGDDSPPSTQPNEKGSPRLTAVKPEFPVASVEARQNNSESSSADNLPSPPLKREDQDMRDHQLQKVCEEAMGASGGAQPNISPDLVDWIKAELKTSGVKYIYKIQGFPARNSIELHCNLQKTMGTINDPGRIALFRMIEEPSPSPQFWSERFHRATLTEESVKRIKNHGIKSDTLVSYLISHLQSSNVDYPCFNLLADWLRSDDENESQLDAEHALRSNTFGNGASSSQGAEAYDSQKEGNLEEPAKKQHFELQKRLQNESLDVVEKAVQAGVKLLDALSKPLQERDFSESQSWLEQIEKVKRQAVKTKTIVGVVGNTGAGKSSVINALLDSERLVPTNCMRACTAVITEISYNSDSIPYRAEIEYIERHDWERELTLLFQEILDGNGTLSREISNEDTEAGVAYAKIKAVYPKFTKEMIEESSVEQMMRHPNVSVLGKSEHIKEHDSLKFYKRLQAKIDSSEKKQKAKETGTRQEQKEANAAPALWPLIRLVRIYSKAPALEKGTVLVDLPGVHDSNAARAKIAENYMKACTGLWIVAPINRAVDDKAAKVLLGETFKRQLKMDGGFSTVTFICSKTDDISVTEAQESLGIEEEIQQQSDAMSTHEQAIRKLKGDLRDLKDAKIEIGEQGEKASDEKDIYDTLRDDVEDGKKVFAPRAKKDRKRKRGSGHSTPRRKRQRRSSDASDSDFEENSEDSGDDRDEPEDIQEPLTLEQITSKISELRKTSKSCRIRKGEIDDQIETIKSDISSHEKELSKVESQRRAKCIAGRNEYSKYAIQKDFAGGIREIDQEIAEEADTANFDPEAEARDYDAVARSLPVYCVSSRAYLKLAGMLRQEADVPGFTSSEETQIPQLQEHCRELTVKGRSNACKNFLASLSQLLNSLSLWSSNDGSGNHLSQDQRTREEQILQQRLKTLESNFDKLASNNIRALRQEIGEQVYEKFGVAIDSGKQAAEETVSSWGSRVDRDNPDAGGLHWSTYKAVCRRYGVYSNGKRGPQEWNAKLAEPILKQIASGWERAFSRRVHAVMKDYVKDGNKLIKDFHNSVAARAHSVGSSTSIYLLEQQTTHYEQTLSVVSEKALDILNNGQKDCNREFVPVVADEMTPAYEDCINERGTGSFARMKLHMFTHVKNRKQTMFTHATQTVKDMLESLIREVRKQVEEGTDDMFATVRRDYLAALGGGASDNGDVMPREQRQLRKDVLHHIERTEAIFEEALNEPDKPNDDEHQEVKSEPSENQNAGNPAMVDEANTAEHGLSKDESEPEDAAKEAQHPFDEIDFDKPVKTLKEKDSTDQDFTIRSDSENDVDSPKQAPASSLGGENVLKESSAVNTPPLKSSSKTKEMDTSSAPEAHDSMSP